MKYTLVLVLTSVFLMFSGVPAVWNKSYFVTNLATTMTVTQV